MSPITKVYRRHGCDRQHRTYQSIANCMFRRAAWVVGDGSFALIAWCGTPTVSLHPNYDRANQNRQEIDQFGCGGRCTGRHEIVRIGVEPAGSRS